MQLFTNGTTYLHCIHFLDLHHMRLGIETLRLIIRPRSVLENIVHYQMLLHRGPRSKREDLGTIFRFLTSVPCRVLRGGSVKTLVPFGLSYMVLLYFLTILSNRP